MKYFYLTTTGRRSGRPRRIEIWFTRQERAYYLVAEHGRRARWVQNLIVDPAVRARVGARSFRARARVVDRAAERELVRSVRRRSEATGCLYLEGGPEGLPGVRANVGFGSRAHHPAVTHRPAGWR